MPDMPRLAALKEARTLADLARLLDFEPSGLSYILFKQPKEQRYKTFLIRKRNGGFRTIDAPLAGLKVAQRKLSDLLQDCVEEIEASAHGPDHVTHGFKRKRSIITNSRQHRNRRYVLNLDLEDFFPSINFGRVRGFLMKNRHFALDPAVATVIAQIACKDNSLPQGSPCSPVISNLVAHVLDIRLIQLASAAGCTYSRYADDLSFSTNKKDFPTMIAVPTAFEGAESHLWVPGHELRANIERAGFKINPAKTHLMYRRSRQVVTGLVVNERVNIRSEYRHTVRAMVHRLTATGEFELYGIRSKDDLLTVEQRPGSLNELHGRLAFIDNIRAYNVAVGVVSSKDFSSEEKVYREFLIYRNFYAAECPTIICEGETDNIYLTHAIRSLAAEFPDLAELKGDKIELKVRLYKYPRTSTARILRLKDGGSSVLSKFIQAYKQETKQFKAPGLSNPVIVLYDSDSGAKNIRSVIKEISKTQVTGLEPFVHVFKNMYAVPTPISGPGKESEIEDSFDAATRGTVVEGKTFSAESTFDTEKHFGKARFAHRVVRPNADSIDFSGFGPLLANIVEVIHVHKASKAP